MQRSSIEWAQSLGAPITCATCTHFHEGNGYCGQTNCGGPGAGRDFPCYDGPIPREKLVERCLACGSGQTTHLIAGLNTKFSLCKQHKDLFKYVGQPNPHAVRLPVVTIKLP